MTTPLTTPLTPMTTPEALQTLLASLNRSVLVLKFGAEWCKPCKAIAPVIAAWTPQSNIQFIDIDVDSSLDLFVALKRRKMVVGLPTMLAFYSDVVRDAWYVADDSVVGGDPAQTNLFLLRCNNKANKLLTLS